MGGGVGSDGVFVNMFVWFERVEFEKEEMLLVSVFFIFFVK